uniref:DDE-type integrase/transposase/recombinase n=1 Tax=Halomonas piscis TaxID=3031727 RepID=UPI0035DC8900
MITANRSSAPCSSRASRCASGPQGFRPRARGLPSVASRPDERWATDLTHVWCGKDRRASLAVIIDCCTREILGWRLSNNGRSKTAEAALEEALVHRFGEQGCTHQPLGLLL